jgi:conjugal transfer/entry exclusion protein
MTHFESNTQPKTTEALNLYTNLNGRSDSILKQAEQVTNRTQKLLDNANNALESLNKINKSLSGIYLV